MRLSCHWDIVPPVRIIVVCLFWDPFPDSKNEVLLFSTTIPANPKQRGLLTMTQMGVDVLFKVPFSDWFEWKPKG